MTDTPPFEWNADGSLRPSQHDSTTRPRVYIDNDADLLRFMEHGTDTSPYTIGGALRRGEHRGPGIPCEPGAFRLTKLPRHSRLRSRLRRWWDRVRYGNWQR